MGIVEELGELDRCGGVSSRDRQILEQPHERDREALLRLGSRGALRLRLRDRLSVKPGRNAKIRRVSVRPSEPRQGLRPRRPGGGEGDGALEESARSIGVARLERVARGFDRPAEDVLPRIGGREPHRLLGEISGRRRRTACPRPPRSVLDCGSDRGVRPDGGERELPGPLLGLIDELGEPPVHLPAAGRAGGGVSTRGKQRMREREPIAVDRDHAGQERRLEHRRILAERRGNEPHRWLRQRRGDLERLDAVSGKRREPLGDEVLQPRRQGKLLPRCRIAPPLERAGDLERVERITVCEFVQTHQRRSSRRATELRPQDPVERADAERPQRDPQPVARAQRQLNVARPRAQGDEHRNPLVGQAPGAEADQERGRAIEPLDVVDRDEDGTSLLEEPKRPEEGRRHGALIGRPTSRIPTQQRDVERTQLGRRERSRNLLVGSFEQIAQAGIGELLLRFARAAHKHSEPPSPRFGDQPPPERRLTDPRDTLDDDIVRDAPGLLKRRNERRKLVLPTDDLPRLGDHSPIVPQPLEKL